MYFLTLQDPNYMVKGSRDPLGFQVLWQNAGRKLIPHLSTVSASIRDFQVMAMANYCKQKHPIGPSEYLAFFLCFEQAMGYTRFKDADNQSSFNGVDKVRKILSGNNVELSLSVNGRDQLLSNQKSYGIWGKYNRPFTDMGIGNDSKFKAVQERKYNNIAELRQLIDKLIKKRGSVHIIQRDVLKQLKPFFKKPEGNEWICYSKYLLADNSQGELLRITATAPELGEMPFYDQLAYLKANTSNETFISQLDAILNTERVLSPLNRIFRHLQGRPKWSFEEIENEELIGQWSKSAPLTGQPEVDPELSALLQLPNKELVAGLAKRNALVCKRRGSEPWITLTASGLEVDHFDGYFSDTNYDPQKNSDNNYFLATWFDIYRQLN